MVDAIVKEAETMRHFLKGPVETIYFGGGTPSILTKKQLATIVETLYKHFDVQQEIEFTLEANPDDLTKEKLLSLKSVGVNRLSIGSQSFDDSVLRFLNRSHIAEQIVKAVEYSRQIGINNLSLDLIYGIPNQDKTQWSNNLKALVALNPDHVSCYALTIEEKTTFGNWVRKEKLIPKADDQVGEEYDFMVGFLSDAGYEHYEVSNFAKPNKISRHNSSYWHQKPYLGLGPGAHSYDGNSRHFNISSNPKYVSMISKGATPFTKEELSNSEALTEYIFTRLRTKWGIDFNEMERLYNFKLSNAQKSYLTSISHNGMASLNDNKLVLNSKGYFLSDSIALELIPEP